MPNEHPDYRSSLKKQHAKSKTYIRKEAITNFMSLQILGM